MSEEITIIWTFSPEDYFEENTTLIIDGIKIEIAKGRANAYLTNGKKCLKETEIKYIAPYCAGKKIP